MEFVQADLKELRSIALGYGIKRGLTRPEAEEFAQDVLVAHLRERKASIRQLFVDYCRGQGGDRRTKGTVRASFKHISLEQLPTLAVESFDLDEYRELVESVERGRDRLILNLYFVWGMNQEEIGAAAGYTASRVSQLIRRFLRAVQDRPVAPPAGSD